MKVFCLGAAGRISRESVMDLVQHSDFDTITIGDYNVEEAEKVAQWLDDDRVNVVKADVNDVEATAQLMRGYDVVMDGTQITLNGKSTECIARQGAAVLISMASVRKISGMKCLRRQERSAFRALG
ncbi:MAG: saccharopine dehydrogenase NADP-binding domain-containing protein [Lentihominibacter sp.]